MFSRVVSQGALAGVALGAKQGRSMNVSMATDNGANDFKIIASSPPARLMLAGRTDCLVCRTDWPASRAADAPEGLTSVNSVGHVCPVYDAGAINGDAWPVSGRSATHCRLARCDTGLATAATPIPTRLDHREFLYADIIHPATSPLVCSVLKGLTRKAINGLDEEFPGSRSPLMPGCRVRMFRACMEMGSPPSSPIPKSIRGRGRVREPAYTRSVGEGTGSGNRDHGIALQPDETDR